MYINRAIFIPLKKHFYIWELVEVVTSLLSSNFKEKQAV